MRIDLASGEDATPVLSPGEFVDVKISLHAPEIGQLSFNGMLAFREVRRDRNSYRCLLTLAPVVRAR